MDGRFIFSPRRSARQHYNANNKQTISPPMQNKCWITHIDTISDRDKFTLLSQPHCLCVLITSLMCNHVVRSGMAPTGSPRRPRPRSGSSSVRICSEASRCFSGSAPSSASSPTASRPALSRSPRMTTSTSGSSWQPLSLWQVREQKYFYELFRVTDFVKNKL